MVIGVSPCRGAAKQRWRLVPRGDAVQLAAVGSRNCVEVEDGSRGDGARALQRACTNGDNQLFTVRSAALGTQLVAAHSGKCISVAPGNPKGAALIQVTCRTDAAQMWSVQRSIYK
jgi:hypothetical protein